VLSMTEKGSLVVDPFMGVGSTAIASVRHGRRTAGAEIIEDYLSIATDRILMEAEGTLATRQMNTPVYSPGNESVARKPTI